MTSSGSSRRRSITSSITVSTVHDGPLLHLFADRCCLLEFEFPITDLGEDMLPNIESLGHHLPRIYPSGNPMNTPEIQRLHEGVQRGEARRLAKFSGEAYCNKPKPFNIQSRPDIHHRAGTIRFRTSYSGRPGAVTRLGELGNWHERWRFQSCCWRCKVASMRAAFFISLTFLRASLLYFVSSPICCGYRYVLSVE